MTKNSTLKEILHEIKKAKNILLALHLSPDMDSLGSNLALYLALKNLKKNPQIYSADKIDSGNRFLPGTRQIIIKDPADLPLKRFDLYIALDEARLDRVSHQEFKPPPNLKIINIDHHKSNTFFGDLNFVQPKTSSTAELVYFFLKKGVLELNRDIATCLLAGVLTDTGRFRYGSTTPQTLRAAAELSEDYKVNYGLLIGRLFGRLDFEILKIWREYLGNLKLDKKYKLIWSKLSYPTLKRIGASQEEIFTAHSSLVAGPLAKVRGTELALILTEMERGEVRGSLRTRKEVDSSKIAQTLGGGGHRRAAGFTIKGPLKEAERKTLRVVRKYLRNQNSKH